VRPGRCPVCDQLVFFDNSTCLSCGVALGYDPTRGAILALDGGEDGDGVMRGVEDGRKRRRCANQLAARCNWLSPVDDPNPLCRSCRLTVLRPSDDEIDAMVAFAEVETAKRRLLAQLHTLGLPVTDRASDPDRGLAFELLSSRGQPVVTGHEAGVITLDLSESDDAHREFVRQQLGEPYRTVLGHLRHEIGHYYWPILVQDTGETEAFRSLFGDERISYDDAREQHYRDGADGSWVATHVSQYATMHPWEDWAETFAHYLHIVDGLETADAFGLVVGGPAHAAGQRAWPAPELPGDPSEGGAGDLVRRWLGLTLALNAMSRSIGQNDLYPFVLSAPVVAKLDLVHRLVERCVAAQTA
jgi:hypothetical protein